MVVMGSARDKRGRKKEMLAVCLFERCKQRRQGTCGLRKPSSQSPNMPETQAQLTCHLLPHLFINLVVANPALLPAQHRAAASSPPSGCNPIIIMTTTPDAGVDVDALAAAVTKQGWVVKTLKREGAKAEVLEPEVAKLVALRAELDMARKAAEGTSTEKPFNRAAFDDLVKRKMFVVSAFEIHGGVGGLFDLGPASCALKANVLDVWRQHFVLEENMLEMECTCLTPEVVLKTSGHVDKFTDLMVSEGLREGGRGSGKCVCGSRDEDEMARDNVHVCVCTSRSPVGREVTPLLQTTHPSPPSLPPSLISLQVKDEITGECHRADKLLEDFIDNFLETNPTLTRDQQEEHRRVQRQADAYTPEELHALFQVGKEGGEGGRERECVCVCVCAQWKGCSFSSITRMLSVNVRCLDSSGVAHHGTHIYTNTQE